MFCQVKFHLQDRMQILPGGESVTNHKTTDTAELSFAEISSYEMVSDALSISCPVFGLSVSRFCSVNYKSLLVQHIFAVFYPAQDKMKSKKDCSK